MQRPDRIKSKEKAAVETPKNPTDSKKQAVNWLIDAGKDAIKQISAIHKVCNLLADRDKAAQNVLLDQIVSETDMKKGPFTDRLKEIERERKAARREREEKEFVTKLDKQEIFLARNFSIKFNEIANDFEIKDLNTNEENLNEFAILRAMRKANMEINQKTLVEILKSPFVPVYNPIKDYFDNLTEYDPHKEPNYISDLCGYLNIEAKHAERFKIHLRKHLIRCIACSFEIDFNKQVFTIIGDGHINQNSGKTTLIRWLVPPALNDYYMENLSQDKDGLIAITDNFIGNFDELESLSKYELNKIKSLLSKDKIKVRPPYGTRAITIRRRINFFASSNEDSFLTDLTGNVRWIVFKLASVKKPINWNYKKDIDINRLWAQVYKAYNDGEDYKLTRTEIEENENANIDFLQLPPEYDLIIQFYNPGTEQKHDEFYTATDFVKYLGERAGLSVKLNPIRLGKVLRKLGYEQKSIRNDDGQPIKGYYIKFNHSYKYPAKEDTNYENEPDKKKEDTESKLPI